MSYVVRAFPVIEGREETLREMARLMSGERAEETQRFYATFGVRHESWHLQRTPHGDWVIAVTDLDEPDTRGAEYAASNERFASWLKGQVKSVSGVDPETQPLGPPTELLFSVSPPQPRPIAAAIALWEVFRAGTISECENIPEEHWDFRPAEGARSVRELATHIAHASVAFATELVSHQPDLARLFDAKAKEARESKYPRANAKAEVLDLLRQTMADTALMLRSRGEALQTDQMRMFGADGSRTTGLEFAMGHEMYHRGQLATYARAIGLVPMMTQQLKGRKM